jgi:hypothetical protein
MQLTSTTVYFDRVARYEDLLPECLQSVHGEAAVQPRKSSLVDDDYSDGSPLTVESEFPQLNLTRSESILALVGPIILIHPWQATRPWIAPLSKD